MGAAKTENVEDRGHRPFRSWALQHDLISLLGGTSDWRVQSSDLGIESDHGEDPESAFRGQGYLRQALAIPPRLSLRRRTSIVLWAAALLTDVANQFSPIGLHMPTGAFWITVGLVLVGLAFAVFIYPRLDADRFAVVEQSMLTFATLVIFYQCSVTDGANSPYLIWFVLTTYYASYLLPRARAVVNLVWFSLLAVATLLLPETQATTTVVLQLVALLVTSWAVGIALIRQRRREDTLERAVTFQALADPLTSTANMRSFEQYLQDLARIDGQRFAILIADMNGLKGANAVFGHEVGDGMVVRMSRLMLRASGENDQVARFGGDEFAVVIPGGREGDVTRWRKEFEREVERHNASVRGRLPHISVSIGSALYPDDGVSPSDLIEIADRRMYEEKAPAVAPPYEIEGVVAADAGGAFRSARFQDAPREAIDVRDRMRFASGNWLVAGLLTLAAAAINGPFTYPVAAAVCGVYALVLAAISEVFRRARLTRGWARALDVASMIFPLPATWSVGGALSPLLITVTLPVAFYAQNFRPRIALPRVAILLAGYSVGFWAFGHHGPVEETRYVTSLAAMLVVTGIMQYSRAQQTDALATIRRSATLDQLTALPNVYALRRDIDQALARHAAEPALPVPALIVIDLDDFRRANTIAGHRGGDEVLRSAADRLTDMAGLSPVYRVEGDEFAVLVHGLTGRALETFAERCGHAVAHQHHFGSGGLDVVASVGSAAWSPGLSGDAVMDNAEAALRRQKADHRGSGPQPRRVML